MPEMYLSEFLFSCANIYVHLKYSDRQKEETQNPFQLQGKLAGHNWSPALKLGTTQSGQPHIRVAEKNRWHDSFLTFLGVQCLCSPPLCWMMESHECANTSTFRFSSVQSLNCVQLFATPWTAARQASLSITSSQSLCKLMSIESVMPYNHLILCRPLLLPPSTFPSIRVFSTESVLCVRLWSLMSVPTHWP